MMNESETLELKKGPAELSEGLNSISAMLNKHGRCELWLGVRNDGHAVGFDVTEKTLRDISQTLAAHIEPRIYPVVTREVLEGAACVRIVCEGGEAPYFAHGRAFMRVADEDRQLSAKELERLILAKNREQMRWDNEPSRRTPADLDEEKIHRFVDRAGLKWNGPQSALENLGLLKDGRLANAAPLFFAKVPPIRLRCAVFAATDSATILDRHDYEGDILELIDAAQKYILQNIHIGMRLDGLARVDVPEIPADALREAIINAFCHRDYRDPDSVQIAIFRDRVEIRNPGTLYGSLTLADLLKGNVSRRRNPLVADLLRRIDMVEAWGRGLPLILKSAPDAAFREVGNLFIVSFARSSVKRSARKVPKRNLPKRNLPKKNLPKRIFRKQDSVRVEGRILELMSRNPAITTVELGEKLKLSDRAIRQHILQLRAEKLLLRTGGRRAGRWEVLK